MRGGFSLLELLLVLFLVSLLLGLAVPAYGRWRDQARLGEEAHALAWALQQARAEAKRTNTPRCVKVFRSPGGWGVGTGCPTTPTRTFQVARPSSGGDVEVVFLPPYGTVDQSVDIPLEHASRPGLKRTVRVLAVVGKVVVQ